MLNNAQDSVRAFDPFWLKVPCVSQVGWSRKTFPDSGAAAFNRVGRSSSHGDKSTSESTYLITPVELFGS